MKSGVLLLDKGEGKSSAKALTELKRKLKLEKVGHCGTLDPMASGLLVCVFGRATRLAHYAEAGDKTYTGTIRFGVETDTDDITGNVIKSSEASIAFDAISLAAEKFKGEVEQIPPRVSAVKVQGERAYKLARQGAEMELKSRLVRIEQFEVLQLSERSVSFKVVCSKGTYIRSIARDLGQMLGCGACLESLRREASLPFSVSTAKKIEDISWDDAMSVETLVPSAQSVFVSPAIYSLLSRGNERGLVELQRELGVIPDQIIYKEIHSKACAGLLLKEGDRLVFGCNF